MSGITRQVRRIEVNIASGESDSQPIDIGEFAGALIYMPSAIDGDAIYFLASATGESGYQPIKREGEIVFVVVAIDEVVVMPEVVFPASSLKLQMTTAGSPANQGADRKFYITAKS